eukprot:Opistho-1_new@1038
MVLDEGQPEHDTVRHDAHADHRDRHAEEGERARLLALAHGDRDHADDRDDNGAEGLATHDGLDILERQRPRETEDASLEERRHHARRDDARHRDCKERVDLDRVDLHEDRREREHGQLHEQRHKDARRHAEEVLEADREEEHDDVRGLERERKEELKVVGVRRVVEAVLVIIGRRDEHVPREEHSDALNEHDDVRDVVRVRRARSQRRRVLGQALVLGRLASAKRVLGRNAHALGVVQQRHLLRALRRHRWPAIIERFVPPNHLRAINASLQTSASETRCESEKEPKSAAIAVGGARHARATVGDCCGDDRECGVSRMKSQRVLPPCTLR